jgi:CRISPR-associated protein Cas2
VIVLVMSACPAGLRGQLTRWLLEISPGVFVGHVPARVRDLLWERVVELCGRGRALLVHSTTGEQRLAFRVHGHDWTPRDFDGIQLICRPAAGGGSGQRRPAPAGGHTPIDGPARDGSHAPRSTADGDPNPPERWSVAARRRKYGRNVPRRPAPE